MRQQYFSTIRQMAAPARLIAPAAAKTALRTPVTKEPYLLHVLSYQSELP